MGQSTSYVRYKPRTDPDRPKDRIQLWGTYGGRDHEDFFVDFDDEESLLKELIRFDMAGIFIWDSYSEAQVLVYLIEDDEEVMKTSILSRGESGAYWAIYPRSYKGWADYYVGCTFVENQDRPEKVVKPGFTVQPLPSAPVLRQRANATHTSVSR